MLCITRGNLMWSSGCIKRNETIPVVQGFLPPLQRAAVVFLQTVCIHICSSLYVQVAVIIKWNAYLSKVGKYQLGTKLRPALSHASHVFLEMSSWSPFLITWTVKALPNPPCKKDVLFFVFFLNKTKKISNQDDQTFWPTVEKNVNLCYKITCQQQKDSSSALTTVQLDSFNTSIFFPLFIVEEIISQSQIKVNTAVRRAFLLYYKEKKPLCGQKIQDWSFFSLPMKRCCSNSQSELSQFT